MRLLPLLDKPELKNEIIINRAEVMGGWACIMRHWNSWGRLIHRHWNWDRWTIITVLSGLIMVGWPIIRPMRRKTEVSGEDRRLSWFYSGNSASGVDRDIVLAEKYMVAGKPDSSLVILNGLLKKNPDERQKAYIIIRCPRCDVTEDMDKQIYYLALTAVVDLQSATKEYASLGRNWPQLMQGEKGYRPCVQISELFDGRCCFVQMPSCALLK